MSGITGICNTDGRPADPALLQRMVNAIAHRGPDGMACWIDGAVGLGHLMLHTTPESLREKQPFLHEASQLCLTLDGRVDNRKELRAALESKGLVIRTDTDAELVLGAYERWGEDCAQHIIGDFSFAIWNKRERALYCARDPVGIRAFYYHFDGTAFSFCSELRPLLDSPWFQRRPNLGMLGEYLCDDITSQQDTLYAGIQRLPPGNQLVLKNGALRITRYFHIDPAKTIRYASDAEYAEHFFEIFKEAVRCRLRSQTPVSLFVSGGLDSSSILGMTHHLIKEGSVAIGKPLVFSLLSSHPDADERNFLNDVAATWGDTVLSASMDNATAEPLMDQARRFQDFPDYPNGSVWLPLHKAVRAHGSRVTLWGFGGDEWLAGDRAHCADLLLGLRIPSLVRQIRHDVAQSNIWGSRQFTVRDAVDWCLFPLVPHTIKSFVRLHIRSNVPSWITPKFARSVRLRERLLSPRPLRFPTMAQRAIHGQLLGGADAHTNEMQSRFDALQSIEGRYPYYDRRLIEFALALPEEQRWRDGQTKHVLRQAMKGLLPDSVSRRNSKADFSHLYQEALARESAGEVFRSLRLSAEGYVDTRVAAGLVESALRGDLQSVGPAWMILALESWFRTAFPETA